VVLGDATQTRARMVRKQKMNDRDAGHWSDRPSRGEFFRPLPRKWSANPRYSG
jgi:hypothetical protein